MHMCVWHMHDSAGQTFSQPHIRRPVDSLAGERASHQKEQGFTLSFLFFPELAEYSFMTRTPGRREASSASVLLRCSFSAALMKRLRSTAKTLSPSASSSGF